MLCCVGGVLHTKSGLICRPVGRFNPSPSEKVVGYMAESVQSNQYALMSALVLIGDVNALITSPVRNTLYYTLPQTIRI